MKLPNNLLIVLQEGEYSYRRNLGVFNNLYDLEKELVEYCLHDGDVLSKSLKIVQYKLISPEKREYSNGRITNEGIIVQQTHFPTEEIYNNLEESLSIEIELTNDPNNENDTRWREFDFEWKYLNVI